MRLLPKKGGTVSEEKEGKAPSLHVETASIPQTTDSSTLPQKIISTLKRYSTFIGPGLMVSVAYMDPGNYATDIAAGASNRFSLLFVVLLSNIFAIFLQSLCIKLGTVTGWDLARSCREYLPRWLNLVLWVLAEIAIIATDVAEVIGSAIALNILIKVPLPAGVVLTITDVLFVLMAYRPGSSLKFVKYFEYAVALLVLAVTICLCVELAFIPSTPVGIIFRGFAPSREMIEGNGIYLAAGILGSTVMPHSLFLGSGLVQPRLREYDVLHGYEKLSDNALENEEGYYNYKPSYASIKYSLKYSLVELGLTLFTFALFVNSALLIISGATLYGTEQAVDADLYTIHRLLSSTLAPVAGTVFMLALLFSGQSAGIVCTIAGQMVSEGHIKWSLKPWIRRVVTRGISIVPCFVITMCIGRNGLSVALNVSQVILSLLLPFLTAPLIYFTCKKSIMLVPKQPVPQADEAEGNAQDDVDGTANPSEEQEYVYMANNWATSIFALMIWLFISMLNVYAIYQMAINGV